MTSAALRQEAVIKLRRAVASCAYDEVQAAAAEYRRHVDEAVATRPAGGPPPMELAREAEELIRWSLQAVRAARAQARNQYDQLSAVLRYRNPQRQLSTWNIDG
jgi:hypothetical protein